MSAKYVLGAMAVIFFIAAATRLGGDGAGAAQARAWALIGAIFATVSVWLWLRQ